METVNLTILSFGGGQDSTCILYKIIHDETFRNKWIAGDLLVLMTDTGNEHPHTYLHITYIENLCKQNKIPFYFIRSQMGYHPRTWPSLQYQFSRNDTIMTVAFKKVCTDNLKIKPLYNFLDHYIAITYFRYAEQNPPKGKKYIKKFVNLYGSIRVLLGIAAGEEARIAKTSKVKAKRKQLDLFKPYKKPSSGWMEKCILKQYPLVVERLDRKDCQEYMRSLNLPIPFPSNCMMCPYLTKIEILWHYRNLPQELEEWKRYEKAKLVKNVAKPRNLGVKGEMTLQEYLDEALLEFGHLTDKELDDYKFSHGHCVMSSY